MNIITIPLPSCKVLFLPTIKAILFYMHNNAIFRFTPWSCWDLSSISTGESIHFTSKDSNVAASPKSSIWYCLQGLEMKVGAHGIRVLLLLLQSRIVLLDKAHATYKLWTGDMHSAYKLMWIKGQKSIFNRVWPMLQKWNLQPATSVFSV